MQRRLELAQALERFVMGDGASDPYLDAVGSDSPQTLVEEVERHLRALLRDVLCGYLDPDLRSVADDLLLDQPEPVEVRASRGTPATAVGAAAAGAELEPEPEPEPVPERETVTSEIRSIEESEHEIAVAQPDFEWEDPQGFSAPV